MAVLTTSWAKALAVAIPVTLLAGALGAGGVYLAVRDRDPAARAPVSTFDLGADVPGAVQPGPGGVVLAGLSPDAVEPATATLTRLLAPLLGAKSLGKSVSFDVYDAGARKHLLSRGLNTARTPASTAKLLTGAAALTVLGGQTTIPTTTVLADPLADDVYLIGGGDVLLAAGKGSAEEVNGRAGLADLAAATATALTAQGKTEVTLHLDDDAFGATRTAPGWSPGDVGSGYVAPVQPLEIDAGRLTGENYAKRAADPALSAARRFAKLLAAQGIDVNKKVTRGNTPQGGGRLAQVRSADIAEQVEFALTQSDNTVAEALARLVAIRTGAQRSFAGSGRAVLASVDALGVPVDGAVLTDASGLGDGSRLPAAALSSVLALAVSDDHPELRPLITGLPVAAVSGTLAERFGESGDRAAGGVVRAKTGTLSGVSSLAGTVVDADGRLLVFTVMADKVASTVAARAAMDSLVSTLAACGCR